MTRFATSKTFDGNKKYGSLTTMTSAACNEAALQQCMDARDDAVWLLKRAEAAVSAKSPSSEVRRYAHRYFLTDPKAIESGDKMKILSIINLTLAGLKAGVHVKIGDLGGGTLGSVSYSPTKAMTKPHHNQAFSLGREQMETKGAMKLSDKVLGQGRLGVITLIHEATHKYAGTRDYSYFDDDSVRPESTFDDKNEALKNADSYAYFVLKIGRSWNHFAGKNKMYT